MKLFYRTMIMAIAALSYTNIANATNYEITPFVGHNISDSIDSAISTNSLSISNDTSYGLGFAWQNGPNGQGQVLVNYVSHDYKSDLDNKNHQLNITYAHFNGVALYRQANYMTTLSLGLGGAYFDTDNGGKTYPSFTIALGTRYSINKQWEFITELRSFATLTDKEDKLFCQQTNCTAQFSDATWVETNLAMGLAYKF